MESFVFTLPPGKNLKKLRRHLDGDTLYDLVVKKGELVDCSILDTFDNEIRISRRILLLTGQALLLINIANGRIVEQQAGSAWSFLSELEDGPVARSLKGVSRLRAFMVVSRLKIRRDMGLILDDERKTRARLHIVSFFRKKQSLQFAITQSLRGYERAHADLKSSLIKMGADLCRDVGDVADVYSRLGIKSKNYSAKPGISLASGDPIKESATTIIRTYINVARQNETGVAADYDTEFLHDYRVSFRKVRSVLSLFKGVYGAEQTAQLKQEFADLMKQTNRLRDLDVYLLGRDDYFQMVPESSHGGLGILFDAISKERVEEHKKVCKMIKRKSYRRQIDRWVDLYSGGNLTSGPNAMKSSSQYVAGLILKRYRKVCRIARGIDETTADEVVHELRIHCKKLRYLMEFSLPLFSKKKVKVLIKALKVLQDNLGRFNDYSVQQVSLGMFMSGQSMSGKKSLKVAESIGALTAMLYQLQYRERNLVMEKFAHFDSEKIHASFTDLFRLEE